MKENFKILVVDDEEIIRTLLTEHLTGEGFQVTAASSGEEALAIYRDNTRHLLITDIRMGGMSGVKLLEEVKKFDPGAVVVMITSHASLDTAIDTLRAGAYDYIFKPFEDLDVITEVVNRAMDKIELIHKNHTLMKNLEQSNRLMEQANETLRELAITDGLTGLFNHRHFKDLLITELTRAERYDRPLCLLMLDVDRFKDYNDTHGHPAGDEVLKVLAGIINARLRDVDYSARYGGEEFAVLLPETDRKSGTLVAENIRAQVESHPFPGRESQPSGTLTMSIGVAEFPADSADPETLLKKADEALYLAKSRGRNRVECAG